MRLPLQRFRTAPATHIVGLGGRCAVAYNLRRFFDFDTAYPFDWWITPVPAVLKYLRRPDPDYLYDPRLLRLMPRGKAVRHRELRIQLSHEFPRDTSKPPGDRPVLRGWQSHIAEPKARTAALTERLLALNAPANRIAFIRDRRELTEPLTNILQTLFPRAEWTLVNLPPAARAQDERFDWRGDPELWGRLLSRLQLAFARGTHPPFKSSDSLMQAAE